MLTLMLMKLAAPLEVSGEITRADHNRLCQCASNRPAEWSLPRYSSAPLRCRLLHVTALEGLAPPTAPRNPAPLG